MNDTAFIHRGSKTPLIQNFPSSGTRGIVPATASEAAGIRCGVVGLSGIGTYAGTILNTLPVPVLDTDSLEQSISPIRNYQGWIEYSSLQRHSSPLFNPSNHYRFYRANVEVISLAEKADEYIVQSAALLSPEFGDKIHELLQLKPGWDGDDAKPVRTDLLSDSVELLAELKRTRSDFVLPFMAPTYDGSILLDWTSQNRTLEVESEEDGWSALGTVIHGDTRKEYFETGTIVPRDKILEYYDWFRNKLLIWPTQ